MIIKVIGAGCAECGRLYENTLAAACESGIPDIEIQKIEDLIEIVKLGVLYLQMYRSLLREPCR